MHSPTPPYPILLPSEFDDHALETFTIAFRGRKESQTSVHLEFNTEQIAKLERDYTPHSLYTSYTRSIARSRHTHARARARLYIRSRASALTFRRANTRSREFDPLEGGRGRSRQELKRPNPLPVIDVTNFHKGARHRPITSLTRPDKSRKIHRPQYRAEYCRSNRSVDICADYAVSFMLALFFFFFFSPS